MYIIHLARQLEALCGPGRDGPERAVDLGGRTAQDEVAERALGDLDVLVGAEDVDLGVCQHDAGARHVLDGILGAAALAGHAAHRARQVVALQRLHVLDLERVHEQVVQPQQRQRVLNLMGKGMI